MPNALLPLRFLLLVFAGLVNRQQAKVVDYLREENRVLREQIGSRRLRLTEDSERTARATSEGQNARIRVLGQNAPETLPAATQSVTKR